VTEVPGYRQFGGLHPDTAAIRNVLAHAGVLDPRTRNPFSEAAILGIAGGVGSGYSFCPSVPRYGMGGGVSIISRHLAYTWDGTFHKGFFDRLGIEKALAEASSPSAGQKKAVAELEKGHPVLVWCARLLSYHGGNYTPAVSGGSAWAVVVHGIDEGKGEASVADLAPGSLTATLESLNKARGTVCTHKNRMLTVGAPKPIPKDRLAKAMLEGIGSCVEAQTKARIKTFSLLGLETWSKSFANPKTRDGWLKLFPGGRMSWPLEDLYRSIETEGTGGGLMRPMYADFLEEAADATGRKALRDCATAYRLLGEQWTEFAEASLPDSVPDLRRTKELLRERRRLFEREAPKSLPRIVAIDGDLRKLGAGLLKKFPLDEKETIALLESLRGRVVELIGAERAAIEALARAAA